MDKQSLTPLLYACSTRCIKSIQQFLAEGSALRSHIHQEHSEIVYSVLGFALTETCPMNIIDVLIEALSSRRKELLELAIGILASERLRQLDISQDQTLDERTSDVYNALTEIGTAIPVALYSHSKNLGTVFHMKRLNTEVADRLYDAGFRDIEGYNAQGLTPLMSLAFILFRPSESYSSLLSWFVSKGANIMTLQRDQHSRALHFIAAQFGHFIAGQWLFYPEGLSSRFMRQFIKEISYAIERSGGLPLVLRTTDCCSCACSLSGCTMTVSMMKSYLSCAKTCKFDRVSPGNAEIRFDLWVSLTAAEPELTAEVVTEILRLILFEELELSHTCCRITSDGVFEAFKDATDRCTIQEEEADIIQHLEDLLKISISRWQDFSGPLSVFIKKFIADELDYSPHDWDEDYAKKVEDLGVKLDRSP